MCVSCTQWPPHIALPLNRNKTVTNTSAVSPVWPVGHSPEAELLRMDGLKKKNTKKKTEKQKLKSICIYLAELIITLLQISHISSDFNQKMLQLVQIKLKGRTQPRKSKNLFLGLSLKKYNTDILIFLISSDWLHGFGLLFFSFRVWEAEHLFYKPDWTTETRSGWVSWRLKKVH